MRVLLRDEQGAGITKFRIFGNSGVGIGSSFNSGGVPADGLRTQGDVRAGGGLQVHGSLAMVNINEHGAYSLCYTPWAEPNGDVHSFIGACMSSASFIEPIEPRLAEFDPDGAITGVNYRHLSALLVAALQEQQHEFRAQMAKRDASMESLREQRLAQQRLIEHQQDLITARLAMIEVMIARQASQGMAASFSGGLPRATELRSGSLGVGRCCQTVAVHTSCSRPWRGRYSAVRTGRSSICSNRRR